MRNLRRIFTVAATAAIGVSLTGHAIESSPSNIMADRDAQGRVICKNLDYARLRHDGDTSGPTFGRGLIFLDCVYPNYPTGSPKF